MFGCQWKILIDSYFKKEKRFGDLKVLQSLYKHFWNIEAECWDNIFQHFGYFTGAAIYAEVERLKHKRKTYYEPFIVAVSKENYPDKEVISFISQEESIDHFVAMHLSVVESNMPRILAVKNGKEKPRKCRKCDCCRDSKMLSGTVHYTHFNLY